MVPEVRGASERQWSDVQGVLQVKGGSLDLETYLRSLAESAGLAELLGRALEAARGAGDEP